MPRAFTSPGQKQKQLTTPQGCEYSRGEGEPTKKGRLVFHEAELSIAFHLLYEHVACEQPTTEGGQSVHFFDNVRRKNTEPRWEYCELIFIGSAEEEYRLNFYAAEHGRT